MPRNRGWIWFFLILAGLTVAAIVTLVVYNLGQQLKPEQLAEARKLWVENGLKSYQLSYTVKRGVEQEADHYLVRVRDGKVISASVNGHAEPAGRLHHYGMLRLYDFIDRFLKLDAEPGKPRTYTRALFDANTGGLRWFVRRVMGGHERLEIVVDSLEPLE
jgi:hypothetical protein